MDSDDLIKTVITALIVLALLGYWYLVYGAFQGLVNAVNWGAIVAYAILLIVGVFIGIYLTVFLLILALKIWLEW